MCKDALYIHRSLLSVMCYPFSLHTKGVLMCNNKFVSINHDEHNNIKTWLSNIYTKISKVQSCELIRK